MPITNEQPTEINNDSEKLSSKIDFLGKNLITTRVRKISMTKKEKQMLLGSDFDLNPDETKFENKMSTLVRS